VQVFLVHWHLNRKYRMSRRSNMVRSVTPRWNRLTLPEHFAQMQRPHSLQWCRLLRQLNDRPQRIQLSVFPSGIQTAGTKCSTLPRLGRFSASSGRCGNACSVLLRWFVEVDVESVEFGLITFNDASRAALALRMAVVHSSRSSSLAEN